MKYGVSFSYINIAIICKWIQSYKKWFVTSVIVYTDKILTALPYNYASNYGSANLHGAWLAKTWSPAHKHNSNIINHACNNNWGAGLEHKVIKKELGSKDAKYLYCWFSFLSNKGFQMVPHLYVYVYLLFNHIYLLWL